MYVINNLDEIVPRILWKLNKKTSYSIHILTSNIDKYIQKSIL